MRHQDWPQKLTQIIAEAERKPFVWGEHDCCLFAAAVVQELTGVDRAIGLRGTYDTAAKAKRVLKKRGGVRQIATDALGAPIAPLMAQRGDVVLISTNHGEALGVCTGLVCVAPGDDGLVRIPITAAIAAWRVV